MHENIVSIVDVYENTFTGVKCLLVVVEFLEGGDLLTRFENQNSVPYSEKSKALGELQTIPVVVKNITSIDEAGYP